MKNKAMWINATIRTFTFIYVIGNFWMNEWFVVYWTLARGTLDGAVILTCSQVYCPSAFAVLWFLF
jgi:hypothetical protein